jgi:DNA-binding transcriptional ArsR family regulator
VPRLNCRANRRQARRLRVSTVYRALSSLQAAGLVRFHGEKREDGRWRCLSVGLTPAAYGPCPPFGRSRRRPTRRLDGRISFLRRSGTSPTVENSKNGSEVRGRTRARAREPNEEAPGGGGSFLAAALAAPQTEQNTDPRRAWPLERFDLSDARAVHLVELFEEEFGRPAQFSYKRHGPILRRILDRLDRFSSGAPEGWDEGRDRYRPGVGYREAAALIHRWGRLSRLGRPDGAPARVQSLAYFLPKLDQLSKRRRREWRRTHREDPQ